MLAYHRVGSEAHGDRLHQSVFPHVVFELFHSNLSLELDAVLVVLFDDFLLRTVVVFRVRLLRADLGDLLHLCHVDRSGESAELLDDLSKQIVACPGECQVGGVLEQCLEVLDDEGHHFGDEHLAFVVAVLLQRVVPSLSGAPDPRFLPSLSPLFL